MNNNYQSGSSRTFTQDKQQPADVPIRGQQNLDLRRKWCKGRIGTAHELVWQHWFECYGGTFDWQRRKCITCGREMGVRKVPSNQPSHQL